MSRHVEWYRFRCPVGEGSPPACQPSSRSAPASVPCPQSHGGLRSGQALSRQPSRALQKAGKNFFVGCPFGAPSLVVEISTAKKESIVEYMLFICTDPTAP